MPIPRTYVVHIYLLLGSRLGKRLVGSNPELVSSGNGNLGSAPARQPLTSWSSFMSPVRISGPLVSSAMATGRREYFLAASRELSMTDWWYS